MKGLKIFGLKGFNWERFTSGDGSIDVLRAAMELVQGGVVMIDDDSVDDQEMRPLSGFSNADIAINYIESVSNLQVVKSRQVAAQIIVTAFFFQVYV